ncbi:MAG: AAA family ATPase, partial [Succinimonas sp.]|nr:AAA family ATPase [Succinimonas sp.]
MQKAAQNPDQAITQIVFDFYDNRSRFSSPESVITHFLGALGIVTSDKLMVIVDEYDNFTNDILSRDPGKFRETARKGGELSAFFQTLRAENQDHLIGKIYVTGVLPITMDTAISGFVSENLTSDPQFNEMAGFTDDEVKELLKETVDFEKCPFSPEILRAEMKRRYDGYRFADTAEKTVYNATMCLNFIRDLQKNNQEIPPLKIFADVNIDFDKLYGYFMLINKQQRKKLIENLNDSKPVKSNVGMAVKLTSEHETFSYPEGATVLYHLGFLTMMSKEKKESIQNGSLNDEYLTIPNAYYEELFTRFQLTMVPKVLQEIETLSDLGKMAVSNDISVLSDMLYRVAGGFTQTDVSREGENQVALAVYAAISVAAGKSFNLTKEYAIKHNGQFVFADGLAEEEYEDVPDDESDTKNKGSGDPVPEKSPEDAEAAREFEEFVKGSLMPGANDLDTLRGRADLVAINTNPRGPSYIFEFKYRRNTKSRDVTVMRVTKTLYERAVKQLNFYVTDDRLSQVPDLRRYVIMYVYGRFIIREVLS